MSMHGEDAAAADLEIEFTAESGRYDADDSRWLEQVAQLYHTLRQEGAAIRTVSAPAAGSKGTLETVIVALGSAQVFTAAVEVFRAWLARDRSRSLSIMVGRGETSRRVEIRSSDLDPEGLRELANLFMQHESRD